MNPTDILKQICLVGVASEMNNLLNPPQKEKERGGKRREEKERGGKRRKEEGRGRKRRKEKERREKRKKDLFLYTPPLPLQEPSPV